MAAICFHKEYPPENEHDWLENPPFEDVFPIENKIFQCQVSFQARNFHCDFFLFDSACFSS